MWPSSCRLTQLAAFIYPAIPEDAHCLSLPCFAAPQCPSQPCMVPFCRTQCPQKEPTTPCCCIGAQSSCSSSATEQAHHQVLPALRQHGARGQPQELLSTQSPGDSGAAPHGSCRAAVAEQPVPGAQTGDGAVQCSSQQNSQSRTWHRRGTAVVPAAILPGLPGPTQT